MSTISPTEYETRIRALERQCATLAAEIDRMRPVVDVALGTAADIERIYGYQHWAKELQRVVADYKVSNNA